MTDGDAVSLAIAEFTGMADEAPGAFDEIRVIVALSNPYNARAYLHLSDDRRRRYLQFATTVNTPKHYLDDRFTRWSSERLREAAPADSDDDDLDAPPEDVDVVDSEDEVENIAVDASNADGAGDEATGAAAEDDRDDLQNSVYDEFVKSLKEGGTNTGFLSEPTFFRWKAVLCRGVKISHHRSDYCDTCKSLKAY